MEISAIGFASLFMLVALFLRVPVFVSLLSGSVLYFVLSPQIPTMIIAQRFIAGIESIPLLAVAFFVCAGVFMNYSGITRRIMGFCNAVIGRKPGGLAHVNILLSTLMGGLSGSAIADAAMQAKMLVPEMEKNGYSKEFSSVVTVTSSIITPLIPPGIYMILYGSLANVSIGKLFIGGIGPGILFCCALMILVSIISRKRQYKPNRQQKMTKKEWLGTVKAAALPLFLPVVIIGGIRLGVFTPTEAGSVAIVYSLFLGIVVYKELDLSVIIKGLKETVITTSGIMLIVGSASVLAWVLTREQIPQLLTNKIVVLIPNKYLFLFVLNIFLLIIGMFLESNATLIVLVPLLAPIARNFGINEIQFALTVIFNLSIGCISPPMGILMFTTCGITKCKIKDFIREAMPFYLVVVICLFLLTYVPVFTTLLVNLIY